MSVLEIDTRFATFNDETMSNGNCFPLTGTPFGMNYFAMENQDGNWWFNPLVENYYGIRVTHQPSMWSGSKGDFCSFRLLPFTSQNEDLHAYSYSPEKSMFNPAKLTIISENDHLKTELIPTDYGAKVVLTSPKLVSGLRLSFTNSGQVEQDSDGQIKGYAEHLKMKYAKALKLYFHLSSSVAIKQLERDEEAFILRFEPSQRVILSLGTSFVSEEMASRNQPLETAEILYKEAVSKWEDKLGRITVEDDDTSRVRTFNHALYRCFLYPQRCYEIDEGGQKVHRDFYTGTVKKGPLFMNTGFWDTSKTLFPLLTLLDQPMFEEMIEGFYNSYLESGYLPKWLGPEEHGSMPGTLVDSVMADAAVKKIRPDLLPHLYEAMVKSAETQSDNHEYGRTYSDLYRHYGYVPSDQSESISHTLDYAYSDFCISQVAGCLGKSDAQKYYRKRSLAYQNVFDKTLGFMVAKASDGQSLTHDFSPFKWGGAYTEANSFQATFSVFHDIQGLIALYDSPDAFQEKVTALSNTDPFYTVGSYRRVIHEMREMERNDFGQLNLANQPSFHLPYLMAFVGKPYLYQPLLKQLMLSLFSDSIKGLPGDEDNGSMAAWYVFNALGFYPFCPGSGEYVIGIPLFKRVTVQLKDKKQLLITADHSKPHFQFISQVHFNQQAHKAVVLSHDKLIKGGHLAFSLGTIANEQCFDQTVPYSVTNN